MSSRKEHYEQSERFLEQAAQTAPQELAKTYAWIGIGHAILATTGRFDEPAQLALVFGGEQGFHSEQ